MAPLTTPVQEQPSAEEEELTQTELAEKIGAAGKAVVYQWESRKRKPSPVLWQRVERLIDAACTERHALAAENAPGAPPPVVPQRPG